MFTAFNTSLNRPDSRKRTGGANMNTYFKAGDLVIYAPQKPYAPWVMIDRIGAQGTILKINDQVSARVRLDRGGCITACMENLQHVEATNV